MARIKSDIQTLDNAIRRLHTLTDPTDPRCTVAPEHREAVRLYVDTWITPLVEGVRDDLNGAERLPDWLTTM